MNGGTTTADSLSTYAGFSMTFGGTTAGSLTVGALGGSFMPPNRYFDWLTGSQMSFTVAGTADWAEAEWTANRMFFNGGSGSDLGLSWADAINPLIGFDAGGGTYFDWNGTSRTLALVTAVPEPSSFALLGVGMTALVVFRRRRIA